MDDPILGKTYLLFRNGVPIGEGVWTDDEYNGLCWLEEQMMVIDGELQDVCEVCWPDDDIVYIEKPLINN